MGLIFFAEDAGDKLLGVANHSDSAAEDAIRRHLVAVGLDVRNVSLAYSTATRTVTVAGVAPNQAAKEKVVLCCGNVTGVAKVDDQQTLAVDSTAYPPATLYEVKQGDTLEKISMTVYGEATGATLLEANRPMLSDPGKLYPGQQLRVPPKA